VWIGFSFFSGGKKAVFRMHTRLNDQMNITRSGILSSHRKGSSGSHWQVAINLVNAKFIIGSLIL
jgi:diphthamide synthase (EF-2-diphthine--ammonia ligase)